MSANDNTKSPNYGDGDFISFSNDNNAPSSNNWRKTPFKSYPPHEPFSPYGKNFGNPRGFSSPYNRNFNGNHGNRRQSGNSYGDRYRGGNGGNQSFNRANHNRRQNNRQNVSDANKNYIEDLSLY